MRNFFDDKQINISEKCHQYYRGGKDKLGMSTDFLELASAQPRPKWTHTPEGIIDIGKGLIEAEKNLYDEIAAVKEPTVENVLLKYANFVNKHSFIENQITFYQSVSANKELRDASTEIEQMLDAASIEQSLRVDVYKVFKQLYDTVQDSPDIDDETKRLLEKKVKFYERSGLNLTEKERNEMKMLKIELSNLSTAFSKNLNEQNEFIVFTKEELEGVPQDVINQFEKTEEGGVEKYKMTFKYPDFIPVLKYAKLQQTRKRAYVENQNKCPQNAAILDKIIRVRYQIAKLLGYDTYANYVLEEKMAKNDDNVLNFLDDLKTKLLPLGQKELQSMTEFKNQDLASNGLEGNEVFYVWDNSYYNNMLLEKQYNVDHQKIAEYFPIESTIERMLGFYEILFDIKFVKVDPSTEDVWHEDVKQFAVFQNIRYGSPKHEFMGWIYFDMHPREGKYGHAANFGIGPGYLEPDGVTRHTPVTALVCNFTKPSTEKPSLLNHSEVTTFFHELGHGVHSILSQTKYARFHGTHVPRDFVETPSQMLEFWTWSKDELKKLSKHYATGEPIDDESIDLLIRSKNVNSGLFNLRQLHFGFFDMVLHTIDNDKALKSLDLTKEWNSILENTALISIGRNESIGYASFGHIAGGYEAGYYGYLYSQVFANDIYYTLFKQDPMNVENGIRYRDIILKRGGSMELMDCLKELLGREPNSKAFMSELLGE